MSTNQTAGYTQFNVLATATSSLPTDLNIISSCEFTGLSISSVAKRKPIDTTAVCGTLGGNALITSKCSYLTQSQIYPPRKQAKQPNVRNPNLTFFKFQKIQLLA